MDELVHTYSKHTGAYLKELLRLAQASINTLTFQAAHYPIFERPIQLVHKLDAAQAEFAAIQAVLQQRIDNPEVAKAATSFTVPALPENFVARPKEFEQLETQILALQSDTSKIRSVALHGAGGFGKTTLATALCHGMARKNIFSDGIIMVTLGENPILTDTITKIYNMIAVEQKNFVDLEQASMILSEALQDKNCLIVLDDVWNLSHIRPFFRVVTRCTWLITTRIENVILDTSCIPVDEMTIEQSVQLLTKRFQNTLPSERMLRSLARRLGEWPILLELTGSALYQRLKNGATLENAIRYINEALDEEGVVAFDRRNPQDRADAVSKTISVSVNLLSPAERQAFFELAIFPEDIPIPLATIRQFWNKTVHMSEKICSVLHDFSLLRLNLGSGSVRLHDVMRSYLIEQMRDTMAGLHARLLDSYRVAQWSDLPDDENYLWVHLAHHLVGSRRDQHLIETLKDLTFIAKKAFIYNYSAAEQDFIVAQKQNYNDIELRLLYRNFIQMAHLINRCSSSNEIIILILNRIAHLDTLAAITEQYGKYVRPPYIRPRHLLPDLPHTALVRTLSGHNVAVLSCAIHEQAQLVVSGAKDGSLKAWDLLTGQVRFTMNGHTPNIGIQDCSISKDGQFIVSASLDETLKIWDSSDGTLLGTLVGHSLGVQGCAISSDGSIIISASDDGTLRVWEKATGNTIHVLKGHTNSVTSCCISAKDQVLISGSLDTTLRIWNIRTGECIHSIKAHTSGVTSCSISDDGKQVISAALDGTVKIWNYAHTSEYIMLREHVQPVNSCAIDAAGSTLVSASKDGTLKVWDASTKLCTLTLTGHTSSIKKCAISASGRLIVSASRDGSLKLWDLETPVEDSIQWRHTKGSSSCSISADGTTVISASHKSIHIWNIKSGEIETTFEDHIADINRCHVTEDGQLLLSASNDNTLNVWVRRHGYRRKQLKGHLKKVTDCAVSRNGEYVVSASADGTLKVWDWRIQQCLSTLRGHSRLVTGCDITADGQIIVSSSHDGTVNIWRGIYTPQRSVLKGQANEMTTCAISKQGHVIIAGSEDGVIRVWNTRSGKIITDLHGHIMAVNGCAISDDGRFCISVSQDETLKVWDISLRQCLVTFHVDGPLNDCSFTPDNSSIVAAGTRGLYFLNLVWS
jgi:WD40 repeat protein